MEVLPRRYGFKISGTDHLKKGVHRIKWIAYGADDKIDVGEVDISSISEVETVVHTSFSPHSVEIVEVRPTTPLSSSGSVLLVPNTYLLSFKCVCGKANISVECATANSYEGTLVDTLSVSPGRNFETTFTAKKEFQRVFFKKAVSLNQEIGLSDFTLTTSERKFRSFGGNIVLETHGIKRAGVSSVLFGVDAPQWSFFSCKFV